MVQLDKAELFALLGYEPHARHHCVHDIAPRIRPLASHPLWGRCRYSVGELLAAALATRPESYVWIAEPRLETVDMLLELLLAAMLTLTVLRVHRPKVE